MIRDARGFSQTNTDAENWEHSVHERWHRIHGANSPFGLAFFLLILRIIAELPLSQLQIHTPHLLLLRTEHRVSGILCAKWTQPTPSKHQATCKTIALPLRLWGWSCLRLAEVIVIASPGPSLVLSCAMRNSFHSECKIEPTWEYWPFACDWPGQTSISRIIRTNALLV